MKHGSLCLNERAASWRFYLNMGSVFIFNTLMLLRLFLNCKFYTFNFIAFEISLIKCIMLCLFHFHFTIFYRVSSNEL